MDYFAGTTDSDSAFGNDNIINAANFYGYYPVWGDYVVGTDIVFGNISAGSPLLIGVKYNRLIFSDDYHALVVRGYDRRNDYISVWNPWNSYYENMDYITDEYIDNTGKTWEWYSSVYNWDV
jgi:hypothetical protein